ncbi:MAG: CDP-alcohol phosphatidyltransferase family protein [Oscillospiraceae bacterium]
MSRFEKREFYSIPNIMGYFRILLIPFFIWSYLSAETTTDYLISALIIGLSGLTDLFDGMVARKFNMVTELGKFVDPLADKLTQFALVICLATRFKLMWLLIVLFIIKEGFMSIMGVIMIKKYNKKLDGAMWFGKVCTATLYIVMFILLLIPSISLLAANILIGVCAAVMLMTLILYIPVFSKMSRGE